MHMASHKMEVSQPFASRPKPFSPARKEMHRYMPERCKDGRRRVVIERVSPEIDAGRFPIKRSVGEKVVVEADVFADGHDSVACQILHGPEGSVLQPVPMEPLGNDRWRGEFLVSAVGRHLYTVEGWVDHFQSWRDGFQKKLAAQQDVSVDLLTGAELIADAGRRAQGHDAQALRDWSQRLCDSRESESGSAAALETDLLDVIARYPDLAFVARYDRELSIVVDRDKARFSAWYELFPRSCSPEPGRHGTFRDCQARLPYIASMGFDVVYLPPVHPIGLSYRKGKNNAVDATPNDVGSPWAIGSVEGGHKSIHPELGTLEDFRDFVAAAASHGLEVALDIAFQCTPDHPYVKEHRDWFVKRADGTIQYAENPPKKYQDIYPLNFETPHWQPLWEELKSVFDFWIEQGIRLFRVDNPHTKPFAFWEWVIGEIKKEHPDVLFLAEAFTRPHVMYRLAKLGFSESYTYFTWRNSKQELTAYFSELTQTEVKEFFRPNLWPNTPDILSEYLQSAGRPAFMVRLVLAATLSGNYGIYGPPFELCDYVAIRPGSEEYLDSEKYQLRQRDLTAPWSLRGYITRVNQIRRENQALQSTQNLRFHDTENPSLICYSKATDDLSSIILIVVNLDPFHVQSGFVQLDLSALGLDWSHPFQVQDLLGGGQYIWRGARNYVQLTPETLPAHILRVRRWIRSERDFDYFQ